jgi:hypothetical protein
MSPVRPRAEGVEFVTDEDVTMSRLDADVLFGVFLRFSDALATGDEDHRIIERMVQRVNEDGALGDARTTETRAFVTRLVSRMHVIFNPELAGVYTPEELAI